MAAAVVFIVATPFVGPAAAALLATATYNQYAVMGANLERGRGLPESYGRGLLASGATLVGGYPGGGAASAALVGGDPGRGAALGAVQAAVAFVGAQIPGPNFTDPVVQGAAQVARAAAEGAASGAAGAAIVGGDPGEGAAYGAASAAAVAVASMSIQTAIDSVRRVAGSRGDATMSAFLYAPRTYNENALRPMDANNSLAVAFYSGPSTGPGISGQDQATLGPMLRKALTIFTLILKLIRGEDDNDPNKRPPPRDNDFYGDVFDPKKHRGGPPINV